MSLQRHYTERSPPAPLRSLVACYWRFWIDGDAGGPLSHPIPPDGGISVSVRLVDGRYTGALLVGPRTDPYEATVGVDEDYRGIRFWPGAGAAVFGVDGVTTANRDRPLADVDTALEVRLAGLEWPPEIDATGELLDHVLAERLVDVEPDLIVMRAVATILEARGDVAVADLVGASGLSERQFQRRFRRAVGLTAKQLTRVRRIRAAAIAALEGDEPLGEVAHDAGFADQAHMIREFRSLLGQAPSAYRRRIREIAHGSYDR